MVLIYYKILPLCMNIGFLLVGLILWVYYKSVYLFVESRKCIKSRNISKCLNTRWIFTLWRSNVIIIKEFIIWWGGVEVFVTVPSELNNLSEFILSLSCTWIIILLLSLCYNFFWGMSFTWDCIYIWDIIRSYLHNLVICIH